MFRGREIQHSDLAETLLKRMATDREVGRCSNRKRREKYDDADIPEE